MGRKTKFISKDASQKFHLLHRSQTDAAYANDELPSDFVLVATNESNTNSNNRKNRKLDIDETTVSDYLSQMKTDRDHINALGFVNDGYDYSQHLKEMGGGKFIGKNGKAVDLDFSYNKEVAFELPEDALPSGVEMERDLQAITISHDLMDEDIRAALFNEADEDGEFEELQDDFISQAMLEPLESDFDYDAHIAALIARSEEKLGVNSARGWEGDRNRKLLSRPLRHSDEESDLEEFSDMEEGEYGGDEQDEEEDRFQDVVSAEERQKIEMQFERTLEEYGDEEIGELEDDDEGEIALDGDDPLFASMIEEFLQEKRDEVYAEGTLVQKGTRSTILVRRDQEAKRVIEETRLRIETAPVDIKREYVEQQSLQAESALYLKELDENGEAYVELETCQQYLKEERVVEQWDCESILSTYSTLDNHPSLIKDTNTKFRPYKSRHEKSLDAAVLATSETASIGSVAPAVARKYGSHAPGRIVLAGKLNLPEGFGPGESGTASKTAKKAKPVVVSIPQSTSLQAVEEEEDNESEQEEGGDSDNSSGEEEEFKRKVAVGSRPRDETSEEKRLRKLKVKEDRKVRRTSKKEVKTAYKQEGNRLTHLAGREQSTDHVSFFKYSN